MFKSTQALVNYDLINSKANKISTKKSYVVCMLIKSNARKDM
jgi:hypothetical protein